MSSRIVIILADSTPLNIETGKLEQFFLEDSALFCRKLGHKYLMSIWRVARIGTSVLYLADTLFKIVGGNIQCFT